MSTANIGHAIAQLKKELDLKYPVVKCAEMSEEESRRWEIIRKIEKIAWEMVESVAGNRRPVLQTVAHSDWTNCVFHDRHLYYANPGMFRTQSRVDGAMRDVCHMLKAPTWELGVLATSKGVVSGPLVLELADGKFVDCSRKGGVSVPSNVADVKGMSSAATWVLIVEKDASFQQIIENEAGAKFGPCIFVTGKGFPDVSTRFLVCKFWEHLRIPILSVVDADPHGFEIMCVYRFGSATMSSLSGHLACPAVRWLGVHPADIRPLLLDSERLSSRDVRKIHLLLKRCYVDQDENLKGQLKILLEGNAKAEIEGVARISANYLTDVYMKRKLECKDYY